MPPQQVQHLLDFSDVLFGFGAHGVSRQNQLPLM
jgi:hypothetical protein